MESAAAIALSDVDVDAPGAPDAADAGSSTRITVASSRLGAPPIMLTAAAGSSNSLSSSEGTCCNCGGIVAPPGRGKPPLYVSQPIGVPVLRSEVRVPLSQCKSHASGSFSPTKIVCDEPSVMSS